jgi:hypothetical protein
MRESRGVAIVVAFVIGCASSGSGFDGGTLPTDSGPSAATVAGELASTDCARKFECMPYAAETRAFGDDVADCTQQETGYQTRSLTAPGASPSYAGIQACIAQMKTASCQDYLDSTVGLDPTAMPACSTPTPGSLANGAGCAYSRQCASNFCNSPEGQCGNCAPLVAMGGACNGTTEVCILGLGCSSATKTCVPHGGRGTTCSADYDCFINLVCDPTTQACTDYPDTAGATCIPKGDACSFRQGAGLACNTQTDMCETPSQGLGGSNCGYGQANGGMLVCDVGFVCNGATDGFSGVCVSGHASPPGEKCAFVPEKALAIPPPDGPPCEAEALCIGDVCKIDSPTTCH